MNEPRPVAHPSLVPGSSVAPRPAPETLVVRPAASRARRVLIGAWTIAVIALALFLGFGSVTVETGWRRGRSLRVVEIWSAFLDGLPEVPYPALLRIVVFGTVALSLLGAALGFWLALSAAGDQQSDPPSEPNSS